MNWRGPLEFGGQDHLEWSLGAVIVGIVIVAAICAALTGCVTVGRWLAPIQPSELSAAAQSQIANLNAELVKAQASKPASLWPLYAVGAVCLAGGAALGYFLGNVMGGALLAAGGAGCVILAYGLQSLPSWAWWIPFGLIVVGCCFAFYRWYRSNVTVKALVPAIETAEPKVEGALPSGQVKGLVAVNAAADKTTKLVQAEVASVKKALGL